MHIRGKGANKVTLIIALEWLMHIKVHHTSMHVKKTLPKPFPSLRIPPEPLSYQQPGSQSLVLSIYPSDHPSRSTRIAFRQ